MNHNVLQQPTLVLNRNWQPIGIASVARSLIKVWNNDARFVDPQSYQLYDWEQWAQLPAIGQESIIRSTSGPLRVPQVVSLMGFDQVPKRTVAFNRRNLFERDQFTCQYCGCRPDPDKWTIDHVVPRSQGGRSEWTNCVLACRTCNSRKADLTPEQARMPLRQLPKRPSHRQLVVQAKLDQPVWRPFFGNVG